MPVAISKRHLLLGTAGTLAGVGLGASGARAAETPVQILLESEAVILDPHMTTAAITRTFSYHVWDMLFGMDSDGKVQPQMVERWTTSPDQLHWRFELRNKLAFHDGAKVTAADCVASLQRWAPLDALGRLMLAAGATMAADGDKAFTIALKRPFPLMLDVLGKPNAPLPAILPQRIIEAAGTGRIKEVVGSGPFSFDKAAWRPGDQMTLVRFKDYAPRPEPADFLAGGKVVHLEQIVLRTIPDNSTAASALDTGEIDYMQYLPFDLLEQLARNRDLKIMTLKGLDMFQGNFRLNHASPPFDDPAVRAVMWKLVNQKEMLQAAGIGRRYRLDECNAFFMCGSPLATDAGSKDAHYDPEGAKAALKRTGYKGEPVVMMQVSGSISQSAGTLLAQEMRNAGFTVDEQVMDWGTVLARRAKKQGWGLFPVYSNGTDMASPLTHFYIANNCGDYPGWSCDPIITDLIAQFVAAPDEAARKSIAEKIQVEAYKDTPSVMWGQFARPAGYRTRLVGLIQSAYPIFWNVKLAQS